MSRAVITLLNGEVDAEADVEAAYTLTDVDARNLAAAAGRGLVLVVQASGISGSPNFQLDTLNLTLDGTNYLVVHTPGAAITINSNGFKHYAALTVPLLVTPNDILAGAKLKLLATVVQLTASHKITLKVELRMATFSEAA